MNMNVRYSNLSDTKTKSDLPLDVETVAIQHSACWQDMVDYYIFLVGQGRIEESQKLLVESLAGKKTSTKILEHSANSNYVGKSFG